LFDCGAARINPQIRKLIWPSLMMQSKVQQLFAMQDENDKRQKKLGPLLLGLCVESQPSVMLELSKQWPAGFVRVECLETSNSNSESLTLPPLGMYWCFLLLVGSVVK